MRDPREGLAGSGSIRTGADIRRVVESYRCVHDAAVAMIHQREPSSSVYGYGSVVTGEAMPPTSDVDLLTIGLSPTDAVRIGGELSSRFELLCRAVDISAADGSDFVGENDESYGNSVFLRHYCVLLAGPGIHRPAHDFAGDRRAARGFNGDIARHARRWQRDLASGEEPRLVAQRMARKSLLTVAGLVSVHDRTWTTDREGAAERWSELMPHHRAGLARLMSWTTAVPDLSVEEVRDLLDGTVREIVYDFGELIGLWPDASADSRHDGGA